MFKTGPTKNNTPIKVTSALCKNSDKKRSNFPRQRKRKTDLLINFTKNSRDNFRTIPILKS
jgi:hypothetical protein